MVVPARSCYQLSLVCHQRRREGAIKARGLWLNPDFVGRRHSVVWKIGLRAWCRCHDSRNGDAMRAERGAERERRKRESWEGEGKEKNVR